MYKFNFLSCIKIVDFVMMPDEKMGFVEEWCVSNIKVSGSRYASVFFYYLADILLGAVSNRKITTRLYKVRIN